MLNYLKLFTNYSPGQDMSTCLRQVATRMVVQVFLTAYNITCCLLLSLLWQPDCLNNLTGGFDTFDPHSLPCWLPFINRDWPTDGGHLIYPLFGFYFSLAIIIFYYTHDIISAQIFPVLGLKSLVNPNNVCIFKASSDLYVEFRRYEIHTMLVLYTIFGYLAELTMV